MRICVVDDDGMRDAIVVALRASGFAADSAGTLAAGRDRVEGLDRGADDHLVKPIAMPLAGGRTA